MCAYVSFLRMRGTLSKICLKFLSFSERHLKHSYQLPKHHNNKIKSQEQNFIFPKREEKLLQNFFLHLFLRNVRLLFCKDIDAGYRWGLNEHLRLAIFRSLSLLKRRRLQIFIIYQIANFNNVHLKKIKWNNTKKTQNNGLSIIFFNSRLAVLTRFLL